MQIKVNRNNIWTNVFVDQLAEVGVRYACISPGSRSTPLAYALSQNKKINNYVIVDERTSGFFALGISKQTSSPVIVVTTSGTATAELYPAIIEAYQNRVPLIICTADRPAYLRNTGANQTINQDNLYKNHIRFFYDTGLPKLNKKNLEKLKRSVSTAYDIAVNKNRGPVHFNFPFEKPLEPSAFTDEIEETIINHSLPHKFQFNPENTNKVYKEKELDNISKLLLKSHSALITVGPGNFSDFFIRQLEHYSTKYSIPIFADASSGLAFKQKRLSNLISNFDAIIRSDVFRNFFSPQINIHFGRTATSNNLENFLSTARIKRFVVNQFGDMFDSSRKSNIIKLSQESFLEELLKKDFKQISSPDKRLELLKDIDTKIEDIKASVILESGKINEPSILINILKAIPPDSNLMIGNSVPIRDLDFFASALNKNIQIFQNRGASGIDGVTSTALGICVHSKNPSYLITGDLSFYYDLNSLLLAKQYNIPLIVILINNNGGAIFKFLPIANHKEVFDKYFLTPTNLSFKKLVEAFNIDYKELKTHRDIFNHIKVSNVRKKTVIFEVKTNSEYSLSIRKKYWKKVNKLIDNSLRYYEN